MSHFILIVELKISLPREKYTSQVKVKKQQQKNDFRVQINLSSNTVNIMIIPVQNLDQCILIRSVSWMCF